MKTKYVKQINDVPESGCSILVIGGRASARTRGTGGQRAERGTEGRK